MSYKKTMEGVKYLVQNELDMASEENGERFHSGHEAYAVIKEEIEEMQCECEIEGYWLIDMWAKVTHDSNYGHELSMLENTAIKCACEAIQVAAMARKAMR